MIKYHKRKLWKYKLTDTYVVETAIKPSYNINRDYFSLTTDGVLVIDKGYTWDGASGPCFDTKDVMRGSLIHDSFYQMMRLGLLDRSYRKQADLELYRACLDDGMNPIRAWYIYWVVRIFARGAAR